MFKSGVLVIRHPMIMLTEKNINFKGDDMSINIAFTTCVYCPQVARQISYYRFITFTNIIFSIKYFNVFFNCVIHRKCGQAWESSLHCSPRYWFVVPLRNFLLQLCSIFKIVSVFGCVVYTLGFVNLHVYLVTELSVPQYNYQLNCTIH